MPAQNLRVVSLLANLSKKNRPEYNIEYIELLSDKLLDYEKETGAFEITEF